MAEPQPLVVGDREINLTQVLKLANLAESGGQAKAIVADGLVKVNGEVELRKRRQMAVGDVVEVEGLPPVVLARVESP
jgi:ribosome-associated protein